MSRIIFLESAPGARPAKALVLAPAIDLKTVQTFDITLPRGARFVLDAARVLTQSGSTLTGGATLNVRQVDMGVVNQVAPATLTTDLVGAENNLKFTAYSAGTGGNAVTVTYFDPTANNAVIGVVVVGSAITVNLATGVAGAITSTASLVGEALQASAPASALLTVANAPGSDGTGVVTALTATHLAGGTNPELQQSLVDSVTLANSDATGTMQPLTVKAGALAIDGGKSIRVAVTGGATATADVADLIFEFLVL